MEELRNFPKNSTCMVSNSEDEELEIHGAWEELKLKSRLIRRDHVRAGEADEERKLIWHGGPFMIAGA